MDIIKSSTEISCLFKNGRRIHTPFLTLIVAKQSDRLNGLGGRVAFVAGKKQGNAVWRNSAKRRMRAVCHEAGGPWPGYDVVFLAKQRLTESSYDKVLSAVKHASEQLETAEE